MANTQGYELGGPTRELLRELLRAIDIRCQLQEPGDSDEKTVTLAEEDWRAVSRLRVALDKLPPVFDFHVELARLKTERDAARRQLDAAERRAADAQAELDDAHRLGARYFHRANALEDALRRLLAAYEGDSAHEQRLAAHRAATVLKAHVAGEVRTPRAPEPRARVNDLLNTLAEANDDERSELASTIVDMLERHMTAHAADRLGSTVARLIGMGALQRDE